MLAVFCSKRTTLSAGGLEGPEDTRRHLFLMTRARRESQAARRLFLSRNGSIPMVNCSSRGGAGRGGLVRGRDCRARSLGIPPHVSESNDAVSGEGLQGGRRMHPQQIRSPGSPWCREGAQSWEWVSFMVLRSGCLVANPIRGLQGAPLEPGLVCTAHPPLSAEEEGAGCGRARCRTVSLAILHGTLLQRQACQPR